MRLIYEGATSGQEYPTKYIEQKMITYGTGLKKMKKKSTKWLKNTQQHQGTLAGMHSKNNEKNCLMVRISGLEEDWITRRFSVNKT